MEGTEWTISWDSTTDSTIDSTYTIPWSEFDKDKTWIPWTTRTPRRIPEEVIPAKKKKKKELIDENQKLVGD